MRRRQLRCIAALLLLSSTSSSPGLSFFYYFGFVLVYDSGTALVSSFSLGTIFQQEGGLSGRSRKNLLSLEECLNLYNQQQQTSNSTSTIADSSGPVVRYVDGSWFHKGPRHGRAEFEQGPRIPDAVYFDMNDISCQAELFPQFNPDRLSHMQPPPQLFAAYMDACGITKDHVVIVYGQAGCAFLPRVWFTFRHVMGHERVYLMQASLQEWINHGGPIEDGGVVASERVVWAKDLDWAAPTRYQITNYCQHRHRHNAQKSQNKYPLIVTRHDIKAMLLQQQDQPNVRRNILILDPRGSSFVQHGHIPSAIHVPYTSLCEPHNPNKLLSVSALRRKLSLLLRDDVALVAEDPEPTATTTTTNVVLSCGSGVSVCNLYLALEECGYTDRVNVVVYDGSWEEWRRYEDLPKILPAEIVNASQKNVK